MENEDSHRTGCVVVRCFSSPPVSLVSHTNHPHYIYSSLLGTRVSAAATSMKLFSGLDLRFHVRRAKAALANTAAPTKPLRRIPVEPDALSKETPSNSSLTTKQPLLYVEQHHSRRLGPQRSCAIPRPASHSYASQPLKPWWQQYAFLCSDHASHTLS